MANEKIKAWEQQKGESQKAYAAFSVYLELENRSISKVAEKLSVSIPNIRKWSGKNNWLARAAAYDSSIVEAKRKAIIKQAEKDAIRKNEVSDLLYEKAKPALAQLSLHRISAHGIVEMLTLSNALRDESRELQLANEEDENIDTIVIQRRGD